MLADYIGNQESDKINIIIARPRNNYIYIYICVCFSYKYIYIYIYCQGLYYECICSGTGLADARCALEYRETCSLSGAALHTSGRLRRPRGGGGCEDYICALNLLPALSLLLVGAYVVCGGRWCADCGGRARGGLSHNCSPPGPGGRRTPTAFGGN
jgi:hypothetical protein